MSQDGRLQRISKEIINDRPISNEIGCPCGGTIYAAKSTQYTRCSNGELRCVRCLRVARKFGRRGLTCGTGCKANG